MMQLIQFELVKVSTCNHNIFNSILICQEINIIKYNRKKKKIINRIAQKFVLCNWIKKKKKM